MKTFSTLLFSLLIAAVSTVHAAMPSMEVTVSDAAGKLSYKGKTNSAGVFSTGKLAPGNYVVQLNAQKGAVKGQYALVVSAGKQKVVAEGVDAGKFTAGGVALRVTVGKGLNITGQVSSGQLPGATATASSGDAKVKVVNGKRYVWVKGTGSNMGRWEEEGTGAAQNVNRMSAQEVGKRQEHADTHQEGFGR